MSSRFRLAVAVVVVLIAAACWTRLGTAGAARPVTAPSQGWTWPIGGTHQVTRDFAPPSVKWGAGHRGVDLAGATGAEVVAAGDGTVVYAGVLAGRGVVSLAHPGGVHTTYEPVTATVAVGQVIHRGEVIGTLDAGHEGCPIAACLHWGAKRGEVYLNPLTLLQPRVIRLLPMG